MIRAVNERDARVGMTESFAERQASKACAEHDDMRLFTSSFHADIYGLNEKKCNCLFWVCGSGKISS